MDHAQKFPDLAEAPSHPKGVREEPLQLPEKRFSLHTHGFVQLWMSNVQ